MIALPCTKPNLQVGSRTLLAKTCKTCGLLLGTEWFYKDRKGRHDSYCRRCHSERNKGNAAERSAESGTSDRWAKAANERTLSVASRHGAEWTGKDYEILANKGMTIEEKALATGRSYYAIHSMMSALEAFETRLLIGSPRRGQWILFWPKKDNT